MKSLEIICLLFVATCTQHVTSQVWPLPNEINEIRERMETVNAQNCQDLEIEELRLPYETLSHLPTYYKVSDKLHYIHANRSSLYYQHNLVLNRAIFMSFANAIFNETEDFANQPDWFYHYTSNWADVKPESGPINGSALFYDQNMTYANWYPLHNLPFNRTLGLFGPRSWRDPPCSNGSHVLCGSSNNLHSTDYGAEGDNYTSSTSKHTPWYELYLPDDTPELDSVKKFSHLVTLKYANRSSEVSQIFFTHTLSFDQEFQYLPVVYTQPYFDCGRSNGWVVSAVSPFVDHIPRYLEWFHLRRFTFSGVAAADVNFQEIDINPCPLSLGNEAPNYFASTSLCKPTTVCEPLPGFGLQRGGYQCVCQLGLVYPPGQDGPFQGNVIESASWREYQAGFDCIESHYHDINQAVPKKTLKEKKDSIIPRYKYQEPADTVKFDPMQQLKVDAILDRKVSLNDVDCTVLAEDHLLLPEELASTVDDQFMTQARMATRVAHFLSSHLQNVMPEEAFKDDPGFRPDRMLHVDQLYGEALAMVMSDVYIRSSGIYFDEGMFEASDGEYRAYFAPFAFKDNITAENSDWSVVDAVEIEPFYAEDLWFVHLKQIWEDDLVGLHHSQLNLVVRSNVNGDNITIHDRSPLESYTATVDEGLWWGPYFKCDGYINDWVVSYAAPFFGVSVDNPALLEFQGAVAVDVLLDDTEPNQCDTNPRNLWSNTAKCNFHTSKCEPLRKRQLEVGAYKCICLDNPNLWVEGDLLEQEFKKMLAGTENRFSLLQDYCG